MARIHLFCFLCVAACSSAGPYFRDLPATRVTVDGSVFDVRVRGDMAEAVRINPQYAPRIGPLRARAAFAMAQVSGCDVVHVLGDQAQMTGELSCDGRPTDWSRLPIGASYSCVQLSTGLDDLPGAPYYDYDCDPY